MTYEEFTNRYGERTIYDADKENERVCPPLVRDCCQCTIVCPFGMVQARHNRRKNMPKAFKRLYKIWNL